MRLVSICAVTLGACGAPAPPRLAPPPDSDVLAALATHLVAAPTLPSEGLRIQGQPLAPRSPETVARDRELFDRLAASERLASDMSPTDRVHVMLLCTSLLDTSPPTGARCLTALAKAGQAQWNSYLYEVGVAAGGEAAELAAVGWACQSADGELGATAALYLEESAIYDASIPAIVTCLSRRKPEDVLLVRALGKIGSPGARPYIDSLLQRRDLDDALQAAAMWSFIELHGRHGLATLEAVVPAGDKAKAELQDGLAFLRGVGDAAPFGLETDNDLDLYERFADLRSPVCDWVREHGGRDLVEHRRTLAGDAKASLLAALEAGAGFGFDMVKGNLFDVVEAGDVPALLRIRQAVYTRGLLSPKRIDHSLAIVIKHARTRAS
jgi:hypothetical protein